MMLEKVSDPVASYGELPSSIGMEMVGTITRVGLGVENFQIGETVAAGCREQLSFIRNDPGRIHLTQVERS